MPLHIIGSGLIALLAHKLLPTSSILPRAFNYAPLQYSFISYKRAQWLKKHKLWIASPHTTIKGMRLLSTSCKNTILPTIPLGYLVHNETWRKELSTHISPSPQANTTTSIIAGGTNPDILFSSSIHTHRHAFKQTATVVHIRHLLDHNNLASQWFSSTGIWGSLPLLDPHESILILSSKDTVPHPQKSIQNVLGDYSVLDTSLPYPLESIYRIPAYSKNYVLLGDSRLTLHPLAGQGLNCGLYALEDLIQRLRNTEDNYAKIFSQHVLATQRHMQRMFLATQYLAHSPEYLSRRAIISLSLALLTEDSKAQDFLRFLTDP